MDLQQAIQELVETRTFSLEGVKAVQQLKTDHEIALTKIGNLSNELKAERQHNADLLTINGRFQNEVNEFKAREASLVKREKEILRLEIEKQCADKMEQRTLSMFNTVFGNASLKTSVMRNVGIPIQGNPGNQQMGSYPTPGIVVNTSESETINKEVD